MFGLRVEKESQLTARGNVSTKQERGVSDCLNNLTRYLNANHSFIHSQSEMVILTFLFFLLFGNFDAFLVESLQSFIIERHNKTGFLTCKFAGYITLRSDSVNTNMWRCEVSPQSVRSLKKATDSECLGTDDNIRRHRIYTDML